MGSYPTKVNVLGINVNVLSHKSLLLSTLRKCSDLCIENAGFLIFLTKRHQRSDYNNNVIKPLHPYTSNSKLVCELRGSERLANDTTTMKHKDNSDKKKKGSLSK